MRVFIFKWNNNSVPLFFLANDTLCTSNKSIFNHSCCTLSALFIKDRAGQGCMHWVRRRLFFPGLPIEVRAPLKPPHTHTHTLLALPYLGLTAAKGNNVCQEGVKLEPKPTRLFKSTSQVPTSLLTAELPMSNTNKPANSIRTQLL